MKSIETAKSEQFNESTREELFEYCRQAGIKAHSASKTDTLRRLLCDTFGLVTNATPEVAAVVTAIRPAEPIIPPYNLSPNGKWGGRKWRVRIGRPADSPAKEVGTVLNWNGKPFAIRWGEVNVVPEPIYNQLRNAENKVVKSVQNEDKTEQTTVFEFETKYSLSGDRIEEGTADLCGGLQEWYQKKGATWIKARSIRELQAICQALDIRTHVRNERNQSTDALSKDDLIAGLLTFLYGYPDVEEAAA